jgi:hypothetical protein
MNITEAQKKELNLTIKIKNLIILMSNFCDN